MEKINYRRERGEFISHAQQVIFDQMEAETLQAVSYFLSIYLKIKYNNFVVFNGSMKIVMVQFNAG